MASADAQTTGPSSSERPYLLGAAADVETVSLLTVGDSVGGYRMVGIPDGMGAFDNFDGTFTIILNHELSFSAGTVRAHGGTGAFISSWVVDKNTMGVLSGQDQIQEVFLWNPSTLEYDQAMTETFSRFCSGDLAPASAFYNAASGLGTQAMIYTNGEETGSSGRAFAHILTGSGAGETYELARCGNLSFENAVAAPNAGDTTVVIGLDDSTGGQLYIYAGQKTDAGNDVEKAGLTNGDLFGLVVDGLPAESVSDGLGGPTSRSFSLHNFGDVSALSGFTLETQSSANGVTAFLRPEDGHFDPNQANDFYWATTGASGGPGRLWRLRFADISDPAAGGTIAMLLDGTEGVVKPDNLTVDGAGHVLIQEDRGSSSELGRIWLYDIGTDSVAVVAEHDADFFQSGGADFLTTNEESSGIIDAQSILGPGWFLCNIQAHYSIADPELVQGGQLIAIFIPQSAGVCLNSCGDVDGSGGPVNLVDFSTFALCFGQLPTSPPGCACSDLNQDGAINLQDFSQFAQVFGLTSTNVPPDCL